MEKENEGIQRMLRENKGLMELAGCMTFQESEDDNSPWCFVLKERDGSVSKFTKPDEAHLSEFVEEMAVHVFERKYLYEEELEMTKYSLQLVAALSGAWDIINQSEPGSAVHRAAVRDRDDIDDKLGKMVSKLTGIRESLIEKCK